MSYPGWYEGWESVFTDPTHPEWHLMFDGEMYETHHDCPRDAKPDFYEGRACVFCGAKMPAPLWGLYKLCSWDR